MFKIYWPMRVTNEENRTRAGLETISKQVARRRWTWLGHVLRMDHHSHLRIALTWVPEGKRKRSRPRETWRRTNERELKENGLGTWAAAALAAEDRTAWRQRAYGPILHLENGKMMMMNNGDSLSRCSRPKGQFLLYIMEQGSPCSKQCHANVLQEISQCSQQLSC